MRGEENWTEAEATTMTLGCPFGPSALLAPVIKAVFPTSCSAVNHRLFLPPLFMPQSTLAIT